MKIKRIFANQILDSRGMPTIECGVEIDNGHISKAAVPSGASVGKFEALELRDGDPKKYFGKGVLKAIENIEKKIAPKLITEKPDVKKIDQILLELDGTSNKSVLGANAILAVSIAVARAQAYSLSLPMYIFISQLFGKKEISLPKVMFNILNGGAHADNNINFQEFMIMPQKDIFTENLHSAVLVYQNLKKLLHKEGLSCGVGDEGGFAPKFTKNKEMPEKTALDFIVRAIEESGFIPGKDILFCLDIAATQFYDEESKTYQINDQKMNTNQLVEFYDNLVTSYPIYSIEDGLQENDWDGWRVLTEKLSSTVQLVGDDIFVTNPSRIQEGISKGVANAVLIKPNQIGTVTETLQAIKLCQDSKYKTVASHRSGETCDTFISDLVVGTGAGQFKSGAPCRGERVAKYNRLLEIEKSI